MSIDKTIDKILIDASLEKVNLAKKYNRLQSKIGSRRAYTSLVKEYSEGKVIPALRMIYHDAKEIAKVAKMAPEKVIAIIASDTNLCYNEDLRTTLTKEEWKKVEDEVKERYRTGDVLKARVKDDGKLEFLKLPFILGEKYKVKPSIIGAYIANNFTKGHPRRKKRLQALYRKKAGELRKKHKGN